MLYIQSWGLDFFPFLLFFFFLLVTAGGKVATANLLTCWFVLWVSLTLQLVRCIFQHTLKKLIKTILQSKRCRQRLSDTSQELPSLGILMPHHPPWVTFITKQGWMPSEMIQVRANVAHVLSPGKLRNFPRMKLWEPGKPGSFNVLSLADNKASVSKQQDQGQREGRRKPPWEPAGHWLQTGGWILKKETQKEQAARHRHEWNIFYSLAWGI